MLNVITEVLKLKTALDNYVPLVSGKSLAGAEGNSDLRCLNIHL